MFFLSLEVEVEDELVLVARAPSLTLVALNEYDDRNDAITILSMPD